MVIMLLQIEILIPGCRSLKEKRMAIKSIKDRIRNKFNVSIAEVENNEKWQRSTIAVVGVNSDKKYLSGQMDEVVKSVENCHLVEIVDINRQEL